jgi:hypothetical protein
MKNVTASNSLLVVKPHQSAFSVCASDGVYYWVTLPTVDRRAAFKAFGSLLARECGVPCTEMRAITLCDELVSELKRRGCGDDEQFSLQSGLHHGSRFPSDPTRTALYDLLPTALAGRVRNRSDLALARGISLWIGDSDTLHAIYAREPGNDIRAWVIGFGRSFQFNAPRRGLFSFERALVDTDDMWEQAVIGIDRINRMTETAMKSLAKEIPAEWWATAGRSASQVVDQLIHRRGQLLSMLSEIRSQSAGTPLKKSVHAAGDIRISGVVRSA